MGDASGTDQIITALKRGYAVAIDRADKARGSVYRLEPSEMGGDSAAPEATGKARPDRPELAQAHGPVRRRETAKHQQARGAGEASVPPALSSSERERLEAAVASLSGLNADQLCLRWRSHLGGIPPAHLPGRPLARVLAYASRPRHSDVSIGQLAPPA
jgi:hypothetical protein